MIVNVEFRELLSFRVNKPFRCTRHVVFLQHF